MSVASRRVMSCCTQPFVRTPSQRDTMTGHFRIQLLSPVKWALQPGHCALHAMHPGRRCRKLSPRGPGTNDWSPSSYSGAIAHMHDESHSNCACQSRGLSEIADPNTTVDPQHTGHDYGRELTIINSDHTRAPRVDGQTRKRKTKGKERQNWNTHHAL